MCLNIKLYKFYINSTVPFNNLMKSLDLRNDWELLCKVKEAMDVVRVPPNASTDQLLLEATAWAGLTYKCRDMMFIMYDMKHTPTLPSFEKVIAIDMLFRINCSGYVFRRVSYCFLRKTWCVFSLFIIVSSLFVASTTRCGSLCVRAICCQLTLFPIIIIIHLAIVVTLPGVHGYDCT